MRRARSLWTAALRPLLVSSAMIGSKLNLTLVGAAVLASVLTLILALALLAGRTGATDEYYTVYANVSGLKFGSQVLFEGYPVGQVERIEPMQEPDRTIFRVQLSVTEGWKIPEDSTARPVSPGVLSAQIISIYAGDSTTPLKPGAMIPPAGGVDILSTLSSAASNFDELTDDGLVPLLENLNKQVTLMGEILENELRPMSRDLQVIVEATAQNWPAIASQTNQTTASLARAGESIEQLLSPERIAAIDKLIVNVGQTSESLRSASGEMDKIMQSGGGDLTAGLADFRYTMETLARYSDPVSQSMEMSARNFQEFSRQLRRNPSLLLRPPERDDSTQPPLRPERDS